MRTTLEPMSHTDFRDTLAEAIARLDAAKADPSLRTFNWSDYVADADRGYMADAIAASERFDIDAETVADALSIAADY